MAHNTAKKSEPTSEVVDTSTGEVSTIDVNEVEQFLAAHGYAATIESLFDAPAVYLNEVEGAMLAGRFVSVELIELDPSKQYGASPKVTFVAEAGHLVASRAGAVDLIPGQKYSMFLFSTILADAFVTAAPQVGELFAIRYSGVRASGSRIDTHGDPVEYHHHAVVWPDRPDVATSTSWADIPLKSCGRIGG